MTDELYGELSIISTKGNEDFARQVDDWIRQWRSEEAVALAQKEKVGADATLFDTDIHVDSFVASADTIRFADGEGNACCTSRCADTMFTFSAICSTTA